MKNIKVMIVAIASVGFMPSCVTDRGPEVNDVSRFRLGGENYGVLDREDEVYPWLAPEYDKGIYASSAETAPFRDNALTSENLRRRIQKTSKKSRNK
jgi:hypothetical protein